VRRVRRASRPSTLPIARAGLLQQHDIARDALGAERPPAACLTPPCLRPHPHAVPRPHPLHQAPTHPRYATRGCCSSTCALPSLTPRARRQSQPRRRSQRVPACIGPGMCDTTAICSSYTSVPPSHTPLSSPPAHGHHLRHYYTLPLDACASRALSVPPFGTRGAPSRARSTRCRRSLSSPSHNTAVFRPILPSALGACAWARPRPDLKQCPVLARSAVVPRGRANRCLCTLCDVLGTLPL
jgi:hypothetical protein